MRYLLSILAILYCSLFNFCFAQSSDRTPGPAEKRITDSICNCVSKLDLSKITTKEEATAAYTNCVLQHADLLAALAKERNVELNDQKAMEAVGVDIAFNLLKQGCKGFKELALLLGGDSNGSDEVMTSSGILKRIDNNGFNYFVLTDDHNNETSFIWLTQFNGSEKFMNGAAAYIGKKLTIKYKELEVYLPKANGYYKVKEITDIAVEQ